ncbi:MAG: Type 1 glutamine amidotransferase-like domain-containing protein [Acidimicrobiales bacterium]
MASDGRRHVFASGGSLSREGIPSVVTAMLDQTGVERPRLCFVPTADETDLTFIARVQRLLAGSAVAVSDLRLFPMPNVEDPAELLLSSDAIFVGGGSTANMLAIWRVHGIDGLLRRAWENGVVLGGWSAGAICWFEGGLTDSFGPALAALLDGLGILAGSYCPHYDEVPRRARFHEVIASGALPAGLACENGVTAHFVDSDLAEVLSEAGGARAWRVRRDAGGGAVEESIETRPFGR